MLALLVPLDRLNFIVAVVGFGILYTFYAALFVWLFRDLRHRGLSRLLAFGILMALVLIFPNLSPLLVFLWLIFAPDPPSWTLGKNKVQEAAEPG